MATLAQAAEIRVMSGGAPQHALAALTPVFEKQTGHKVIFTYAVITDIRKRLLAGEQTDMVLMPVPVIEEFIKDKKMRPEGHAALGRLGINMIVREGASVPDISTPEAFKKVLLDARSVVYSTPTATPSGAHMAKLVEQLGIAQAVQQKVIYRPALEGGAELVASGAAEVGIYPSSEIMHVKGVTLVGPLPRALQLNIVYGTAAMADNQTPAPALEFMRFLADPANRPVWQDAGFATP